MSDDKDLQWAGQAFEEGNPNNIQEDAIMGLLRQVWQGKAHDLKGSDYDAAVYVLMEYQKNARRVEILEGILAEFPTCLEDFLQDDDQRRLFGLVEED